MGVLNGLESKKKTPAWRRKEGKSPEGGLNDKGRASYKAETGRSLHAPVKASNPSKKAQAHRSNFCSRMKGMKNKLTSAETAKDPNSDINKSLRRWEC